MTDTGDLVDVVNNTIAATIPTAHAMGVRAVESRRGHAIASVPLEGNSNHFGVMYAGTLFTVAEVLGGMLALAAFDDAAYYPLIKSMHIDFSRPAKTDVHARATMPEEQLARIQRVVSEHGKCDYTVDATVVDAHGSTVAAARGTYQLRRHAL